MTTTPRHQAPDERVATHNRTTPHPPTSHTSPTLTAIASPSPINGNMDTPPTNTPTNKKTTLEVHGTRQDPLEYTVNQYSPPVPVTQRGLRHIKRTTKNSPTYHTYTTHTGDRKRRRTTSYPTPDYAPALDIPSPSYNPPPIHLRPKRTQKN